MRNLTKISWLSAWEQYMSDTESPIEFNTWCGISALAATMKRNVWIDRGKFILYPNQYIILISPPGIGKGTAINPILELLEEAGTANLICDRVTAEKVIEMLSNGFGSGIKATQGKVAVVSDRTSIIAATELPIYLNSSVWTMELMCDLWDNKPGGTSYSTKTKSSFAAKDTCVSLIGGCVPDYIRKLNREAMTAVTGGFTSRCIFVFGADKSKLVPWPTTNGHYAKLKKDLVNDLQHISTLSGEVTFSKDAKTMWENHYLGYAKSDPFESEVMAGFKSRTMAHVFKAAMALAVAEDDTLVVQRQHLYNAIGLIDKIRNQLDVTFRAVGESSLASAQDRILTYIDLKAMASRSNILRDNRRHITDEDLTRVLYILTTSGLITEQQQGNGTVYMSTQVKGFGAKKP